jgi:hypothetical protein
VDDSIAWKRNRRVETVASSAPLLSGEVGRSVVMSQLQLQLQLPLSGERCLSRCLDYHCSAQDRPPRASCNESMQR